MKEFRLKGKNRRIGIVTGNANQASHLSTMLNLHRLDFVYVYRQEQLQGVRDSCYLIFWGTWYDEKDDIREEAECQNIPRVFLSEDPDTIQLFKAYLEEHLVNPDKHPNSEKQLSLATEHALNVKQCLMLQKELKKSKKFCEYLKKHNKEWLIEIMLLKNQLELIKKFTSVNKFPELTKFLKLTEIDPEKAQEILKKSE